MIFFRNNNHLSKGKFNNSDSEGLFGKKKEWSRSDLNKEISKSPFKPRVPSGSNQKRRLWEEVFPYKRFGDYISQEEAKKKLRELRHEETFTEKSSDKRRLKELRDYFEKETGLKGKY